MNQPQACGGLSKRQGYSDFKSARFSCTSLQRSISLNCKEGMVIICKISTEEFSRMSVM